VRKIKGELTINTMITVVIAITIGLVILTVVAPPIQNASPAAFLPGDLVGGLEKDATP
jgi:hypothetical protein